eukprot:scaffold21369_cov100-Phaeocystis_antarctica.AAC.2
MDAFDLVSFFAQPAAAAGSRAAAERQARGLGTGTSDPRRRPEGDQGRCTGCVRRARARPSPSVTVDLVCPVEKGAAGTLGRSHTYPRQPPSGTPRT